MPAPARWFVRIWTVDPAGEGPDEEENVDVASEKEARTLAKHLRLKKGKSAGAFERQGVHVPDDIASVVGDPPPQFWEWEDVQVDEDEVDKEYEQWRRRTSATGGP